MAVLVHKHSHTLLLCGGGGDDDDGDDSGDGGAAVAAAAIYCLDPSHSHVKIVKHNGVCFAVSTVNPVSFPVLLVFIFACSLRTSVCMRVWYRYFY